MRPVIAEFDRSTLTPWNMLRSMPAEMRGVVQSLHDALKGLRTTVFRAGDLVLDDSQIAAQAWMPRSELDRVLPAVVQAGFMARDDEGALFSPHLYDKLLRKEERAARKAAADAYWQQQQENGDVPDGLTRKQITARENGKKGGRPPGTGKKSAPNPQQRHMPLASVIQGGKTETENPNQKPNSVSVSENPVSSVSIDLELERDNNISSSSISGETENPNPDISPELVSQTVARMIAVTGMQNQAGYAVSFAKKWLKAGAQPDTIIAAIREHTETMRGRGDEPGKFKVFEAEVFRQIELQNVRDKLAVAQEQEPQTVADPVKSYATQRLEEAQRFWKSLFHLNDRNIGRTNAAFAEQAEKHGFPPADIKRHVEDYAAYYRDHPAMMETVG
ncbi:hypothetical protein [Acetobacter oryzifermentans]|uniref:Uncharacterized protein n=1 Tax=Acetobacter oryzifermentans TaxID=1633874 RepID=A0ABN4NW63_9PROT|nr:hypothetical protein [Acetobacter oryzifermentans]ANA14186.1 hypothetical protein WG31_09375 [Acetobacter oryzifermentans]